MPSFPDYARNRIADWLFRGQSLTVPTTFHLALFRATAGISPRSTAVTLNQTTVPLIGNGRVFRCTTAGTTGATEPTWPTTNGGTVTDGSVVWTDMTADFRGNTTGLTATEISGNGYARQSYASSLANWSGTQGASSTVTSSGSTGVISNNNAINFPTPTAAWGMIAAAGLYDASTVGNLWQYGVFNAPLIMTAADLAIFPAGQLAFQFDN